MLMTKLKIAAVVLVGVSLMGTGAGAVTYHVLVPGESVMVQAGVEKPKRERRAPVLAQAPEDTRKEPKQTLEPPKPPEDTASTPQPTPRITSARELRQVLREPTDFSNGIDPGIPLIDALNMISKRYGITFRIDEAAFRQEGPGGAEGADIGQKPIKGLPPYVGIPLATILRDLLTQLDPVHATYLIRGSYIEITTLRHVTHGGTLHERVNVAFEKRPLDEVLQELAETTGTNILLDPRVKEKAKGPVTATLQQATLETVVLLLARMSDLWMVAVDNVLYVTNSEGAAELRGEQEQRKAKEAEKEKARPNP